MRNNKIRLSESQLHNQQFDEVSHFYNGFARVKLKGKWNHIDTNGELVSPNQWFDYVDNFFEGFAMVELNRKFNFINTNGEILSPNQWFDRVSYFINGFASVILNGEYFYLDTDGNIVQNKINENRRKNRIRLTETQLRNVIKESVRQMLSELDWKTYANAAKKAREQGRDSRWDFDRATERALDKQYGGHHLVGTDNETYQDFHTYNDDPFSTNYDRAWRPLEGHEDFGSYADVHDSKKPYGNEDIANFVHGKSKYVKGKGWQ